MSSRSSLFAAALLLPLLAGCLNPRTTRFPTWYVGDPRVEQRALERHDPFPSRTMGPETNVRPQGHINQRSDIRRLNEENALRGLDQRRIPPGSAPTTTDPYPATVRE